MMIKVGYATDWTGPGTIEYQIIDETISGKYVCHSMPRVYTRMDGSQYLAYDMTGLFLRDKDELTDVHEENILD